MPLFPRWTNNLARISGAVALTLPVLLLGGLWILQRTTWVTGQGEPVEQPIQFDHRHHVKDEGIDCRYCHTSAESGPTAGMPSTQICMSCHEQIWNKSAYLSEVRSKYFEDRPIQWQRVHDLPDYVYFNHSIHVNKGVGCATCHGRVDEMAAVKQNAPLTMGWCLECHRDPAPNLRPAEQITSMVWTPQSEVLARKAQTPHAEPSASIGEGHEGHRLVASAADVDALAAELAAEYHVHSRTSCSTCHR